MNPGFRLTFRVKRDLYTGETMDSTHSERKEPVGVGSEWIPGSQGQAGCETRIGVVDRDETVYLPGETDAPRTSRPLAVSPLALSRRSALAGAGQAGEELVRLRTLTLDDSTTGLQPQAARELNQSLGGEGKDLSQQAREGLG